MADLRVPRLARAYAIYAYAWAEFATAVISWAAVQAFLSLTRFARALAALALASVAYGLSHVALWLARAIARRARRLQR